MKILTISYEYPPIGGGGATVCQEFAEALARRGHEIDVVTSGMPDLPAYEERNGVRIHRVPCARRQLHYSTAQELLTQIIPSYRQALELTRRRQFDIAHCHFIVPSGAVANLLWRRTGLPYVLTAHGSDVPGYNPDRFASLHALIRPFWIGIIRGSNALVAPSEFLKKLIRRCVDVPVDVIPNAFDRPSISSTQRRNRLLVATRMVERKGVQFLLPAIAELGTDWDVCVAGDGPQLEPMKAIATSLGLSSVSFRGFVPREELAKLYESAKVFVLPSLRENFPMVLLEAMAGGCAVVTTTAPGCVEVVGDAGVCVEPGSVDALRDALARLLRDEAELERLQRLGQRRVARFASATVVEEYEAVFERRVPRREVRHAGRDSPSAGVPFKVAAIRKQAVRADVDNGPGRHPYT